MGGHHIYGIEPPSPQTEDFNQQKQRADINLTTSGETAASLRNTPYNRTENSAGDPPLDSNLARASCQPAAKKPPDRAPERREAAPAAGEPRAKPPPRRRGGPGAAAGAAVGLARAPGRATSPPRDDSPDVGPGGIRGCEVIDMPAVIEIVSLLEKVTITKELLETTRLGKHVNELRRKTDNDSLSKRAKELVKKWRNMVLPDSNGQLKAVPEAEKKRPPNKSPPIDAKRPKLNGQTAELELSDNSNSSFKDVISTKLKRDVILINSDSNSSFPEAKQEPQLEQQLPKKRGRKKGSKNHKNLLDEAETSFTNKLAVSRGNSKVKTTQELIAGLQNKNNSLGTSPIKPKEDLNLRAAKLTERVSIIDQKLNTNANRYKNSQRKNAALQKINLGEKNDRVIESGSVINDKSLIPPDEEVIVVDDIEPLIEEKSPEPEIKVEDDNKITSLSVEEALAQLPPIDPSALESEEPQPACSCQLKEHKDFAVDESEELGQPFEFVEDGECAARLYFEERSKGAQLTPQDLHSKCIENVNGNWGTGTARGGPEVGEDGLYVNVVPNVNNESIPKDVKADFSCENYKKYSISECDRTGGERVFREWHEVLDTPSYNGEIFKILPYVIID
ncbi:Med26 domain containing protein [Asbolus verrucosus]|uniref:Mediator of RNA polymerase II transcription subunit 26 n=1 Tax=Asbolus verrucosus TaxID=1661398 RepID=A0A482WAX2_ASBVE|nr:Med26 domain containing protein [Asbolus verrucosus]